MFKTILLSFTALLAIQAVHTSQQNDLKLEDVKQLFENLTNTLDSVITKIDDLDDKLVDDVDNANQKVIDEIEKEVYNTLDKLLSKFSEIKASDKDPASCVDEYEPQLTDIPETVIENVVSCLNDKIDEYNNIMDKPMNEIDWLDAEINDMQKELNNCGNGPCLVEFADKVKKLITGIYQIEINFEQGEAFVRNSMPSFSDCGVGKTENVVKEGEAVLDDFVKCVANL